MGRVADLVGGYAIPLLLTDNSGHVLTLFYPTVSSDLVIHPWRVLALAVGASVRVVPKDPGS